MLNFKLMPDFDLLLSRDSFLLGFELRLFWTVAFIYALSLTLHILHAATFSRRFGRYGHAALWAGAILHAGLIAFRAFETDRVPFQTLYESLSLFAFSTPVTYLYVSRRWRPVYLPGVFVSALSLFACLIALLSRSPSSEPLSPVLQSHWFDWHVTAAFLSYAVFAVSASIEAAYLIARQLFKRGIEAYGFKPSMLDSFHGAAFKLVLFGFPILTFSIFSGAAWANEAWGRYWSWNPEELWSLITWTVFAAYLHSMTVPRLKGTAATVFNLIGFVWIITALLGVNWLAKLLGIPSIHVYAL